MMRLFFCLAYFVLVVSGCPAQERGVHNVFENGYEGYSCFRIPAIVRTPEDVLLAFAEARRDGTEDKGGIDIVLRRSADGGASWSDLILVWSDGENTCGNPTPVVEQQSGRICLFACWNRGDDHENDIESGQSRDTRRVFVLYSDDDGLSWTKPKEVTPELKREGWTWYATGPCHAIQKQRSPHKGRLVVPANHKRVNELGVVESYSHLVYSDDRGESWRLGAVAQQGGNESSVAELSDGSLMLNMRHFDPADSLRLCAVSRDGGATWSRTWEETRLLEPRCQGSLLNYPAKGGKPSAILLFSNPHARTRRNLSIGVSRDDGVTWERFVTVRKGRAAYSDLVAMPGGGVGILYENGDKGGPEALYRRISFEVIPAERLLGGSPNEDALK